MSHSGDNRRLGAVSPARGIFDITPNHINASIPFPSVASSNGKFSHTTLNHINTSNLVPVGRNFILITSFGEA